MHKYAPNIVNIQTSMTNKNCSSFLPVWIINHYLGFANVFTFDCNKEDIITPAYCTTVPLMSQKEIILQVYWSLFIAHRTDIDAIIIIVLLGRLWHHTKLCIHMFPFICRNIDKIPLLYVALYNKRVMVPVFISIYIDMQIWKCISYELRIILFTVHVHLKDSTFDVLL